MSKNKVGMKIFSNTAISLDGHITTRLYENIRLGSEYDLIHMDIVRARADAVIFGGKTFRNLPIPIFSKNTTPHKPVWNVIVTVTGDLPFQDRFLNEKRIRPLVYTTQEQSKNVNRVECVGWPAPFTMTDVVQDLKKRGVQNLLVEGGGEMIFQFLQEGLLDEMYVTLCPKIIGGQKSPSLVSGEGFLASQMRNLKLLSQHTIHNEIYLHYEVLKS